MKTFAKGSRPLDFKDPHLYPSCSFCGKYNNEVKMLIAGPSSQICDECVVLAVQILMDKDLVRFQGKIFNCHVCKEQTEHN